MDLEDSYHSNASRRVQFPQTSFHGHDPDFGWNGPLLSNVDDSAMWIPGEHARGVVCEVLWPYLQRLGYTEKPRTEVP